MKTQDAIKIEIGDLFKQEAKLFTKIDLEKTKLKTSYDWSWSCAFLFADKQTDAFIYIDDDLNYCFDLIEKVRYLSISIESNIFYYAFVYSDLKLKGSGKDNLNKESGDLLIKQLIKEFFK